jgi:hypothetical protein
VPLDVAGDDDGAGLGLEARQGADGGADSFGLVVSCLARKRGRSGRRRLRCVTGAGQSNGVEPGAPGFLAAHVLQGPAGAGRDEPLKRCAGRVVARDVHLKDAGQRLSDDIVEVVGEAAAGSTHAAPHKRDKPRSAYAEGANCRMNCRMSLRSRVFHARASRASWMLAVDVRRVAEREGFEPSIPLQVRQISSLSRHVPRRAIAYQHGTVSRACVSARIMAHRRISAQLSDELSDE